MAIVYRSVKGSNLTPTEVDDNFHDVDDRITDIEDNPPLPVSVANITQSGNQLYIYLTDATVHGPFDMPTVAMDFRGPWTPSTAYYENDLVTRGRDGFYLVLYNHISDTEFDEEELNESDQLVYQQVLGPLGLSAPVEEVGDATFVPTLGAANVYHRMTTECEVTIPTNISVAFEVSTEMHFRQCTSGTVSFIPEDETVTINYREGYDSICDGQGAVVTFKKVDTNEWDAFGAFALLVST